MKKRNGKNVGNDTGNAGIDISAYSGKTFAGIPSQGMAGPPVDALNPHDDMQ